MTTEVLTELIDHKLEIFYLSFLIVSSFYVPLIFWNYVDNKINKKK